MRFWKICKNSRGSVTAFVAIVLASVCCLNCILLDLGRGISSRKMAEKRVQLACDSILASFDSRLAACYGLYGVNRIRAGNVDETFVSYLDTPRLNRALCLTDFPVMDQQVRLYSPLSEPDVLREQIVAQMKLRTPVRGATWLLEHLGILQNGETAGRAALLLAQGSEMLIRAEDLLSQLTLLLEGLFPGDTACVNGYVKAMWLHTELEPIILGIQRDHLQKESLIETLAEEHRALRRLIMIYYEYHNQSLGVIRDLQLLAEEIRTLISEADRLVGGQEAGENAGLQDMVRKLERQTEMISNTQNMQALEINLRALGEKIDGIDWNLQFLQGWSMVGIEDTAVQTFLENIQNALCVQGIRDDFHVAMLQESSESTAKAVPETNLSLPEGQEDDFEIPEDLYTTLPSILAKAEASSYSFFVDFSDLSALFDLFEQGSMLDGLTDMLGCAYEELLMHDYILCYFGNQVEPSSRGSFSGEMEYMIGGKPKSSENQKIVSNRLMFLRFVLNLSHVFSDGQKQGLADEIGRGIALALSGGIGGTFYAILVMCAWAATESYLDVEALLKGEEVPLLKQASDWKSSIDGLFGAGEEGTERDNITNLSYTEYLMILLMLEDTETKLLRIADVIEINMTQRNGLRYKLSGLYTGIQGSAVYQPDYIGFRLLPIGRRDAYAIYIQVARSYT